MERLMNYVMDERMRGTSLDHPSQIFHAHKSLESSPFLSMGSYTA